MNFSALFFSSLLLIFVLTTYSSTAQHHQKHQRNSLSSIEATDLPTGYNELFAGSGECLMCHTSMTNSLGEPIGIINDWRSTMLANSAKDPLWRAKVSHEGLVNPEHAEVLENVCTRCHAPQGNFNAHHSGQEYYGIADMTADSLALDGISCTVCHQVKSETMGNYSGNLLIGTAKQIWGPYIDPFTMPMLNHTSYTPSYGEQISDSRLCGTCHTLITNSVDLNGNPTGEEFVEQALYHEWLNSDFPDQGTSCQTCHVPQIDDIVKISDRPPWLDGRTPFGMHHLAGANVFMQKILKENIDELGITAEPQQFDSTISRTTRLLQESTLEISLTEINRTSDTLFLSLNMENLAGHKFPSGFPSRRAFIEIILLDNAGDTLFHSGKTDDNFNLIHEDVTYEKHHNIINSEGHVQIYELVMGDVNGDVTTVLERAFTPLKDNRFPPLGFTSNHYSYDTAKIVGLALSDGNFNSDQGNEGTGGDVLLVHAPLAGYSSTITAEAKVWYQTVSAKWLEEMFAYSSDEIDLWKTIYENADREPVLVSTSSLVSASTNIDHSYDQLVSVYPNPSSGIIYVNDIGNIVSDCQTYALGGNEIIDTHFTNQNKMIDLSGKKGVYLVKLVTTNGDHIIKKIIIN